MSVSHWYTSIVCMSCHSVFDVPVYCGDRFCPVCSAPRRNRIRSRIKFLVSHVHLARGQRIKHLTLTIRNAEDLSAMIKILTSSFRRLRNRAYWRNNVKGGAYVVEITGRPGNWHAHIHAVIESYYLDFWRILRMWRQCSPGQGVYIQNMPVSAVVTYLTKYLSKPDMPDVVATEIADNLRGLRLFQPFGTWHSISATYVRPRPLCHRCKSSDFQLAYLVGIGHSFQTYKVIDDPG